jgi:DNA-binding CsgD family transcriptional regulator/N-acetylneuraminic acid mutarotase
METNAGPELPPTEAAGRAELSEREHEILRLVATGASNKQIAQQLVISPNTVKVHLRNIFGKIGVATRTEAALYAIREGLVQVTTVVPVAPDEPEGAGAVPDGAAIAEDNQPLPQPAAQPVVQPRRPRPHPLVWLTAGLALVILALSAYVLVQIQTSSTPPAKVTATALPRWHALAALPTARSGLAAVSYELKVYAIGGATAAGVTGLTEGFDPATNSWAQLAPKPLPVADIGAAVLGGLIYVPGGRLASGQPTNVLEAYNPRSNSWQQRAPLPKAISAYALVAYEGELYVFGGWDGQHDLNTIYRYDPATDTWSEDPAMPRARAFAGAAVASGSIYVVGGENETGPLSTNDQYTPENNTGGATPWRQRAPLPIGGSGIGVTSIADIVYAVGGQGRSGALGVWEYFPQSDAWQAVDAPAAAPTVGLAVAPVETYLFVAGGLQAKAPTSQFIIYQAIYSTNFPLVGAP